MATALDPGFGSGGRTIVASLAAQYAIAADVAVRPDGRIVATGFASGSATARFLPNGTLDTSFNGTGTRTDLVGSTYGFPGALALQPDDKIVVGGSYNTNPNPPIGFTSPVAPYLLRYNPDGSRDATFGASGVVLAQGTYGESSTDHGVGTIQAITVQPDGKIVAITTRAMARHNADGSVDATFTRGAWPDAFEAAGLARQADGRLLVFGTRRPSPFGVPSEIGFIRHAAEGAQELVALQSTGDWSFRATAGAVQPDGKVLVAGGTDFESIVVRFLPTGALDVTFGNGGVLRAGEPAWKGVAVQPDGKILLQSLVELRRMLPAGLPDESFGIRGRFGLDTGRVHAAMALQSDGRIVAAGSVGDQVSGEKMMVARVDPGATPILSVDPPVLDFGTRPYNASAIIALAIGNPDATPITVSGATATAPYSVSHDCGTLAAGASCVALVTFTPTFGALDPSVFLQTSKGTLEIPTRGAGEPSLVRHFYLSILRREADTPGRVYWDNIANEFQALLVGRHEAMFGMATTFFGSAEYKAFARDDTEFLRDLYRTFFDRGMEEAARAYWAGQLASGLPRDAVLVSFMLSPEFDAFVTKVHGKADVPAHKQTVLDFFRAFLARVPDTQGFNYWAGQFRTALCTGGSAVATAAEAISSAFVNSAEYAGRGRTNGQFVADLYNAFMRRGGDLDGIRHWTAQLDGGVTRDQVRQQFRASAEFTARVNAMVAQGCPQ